MTSANTASVSLSQRLIFRSVSTPHMSSSSFRAMKLSRANEVMESDFRTMLLRLILQGPPTPGISSCPSCKLCSCTHVRSTCNTHEARGESGGHIGMHFVHSWRWGAWLYNADGWCILQTGALYNQPLGTGKGAVLSRRVHVLV